jgi:Homeodomain-like domain
VASALRGAPTQRLYDELRPGRPRTVSDEEVALLLRRTLKDKPPAGSHWSVRQAADSNELSKSTVHRIFQAFAVQPHRTKSFKLSNDPFFVEKVRDVVGSASFCPIPRRGRSCPTSSARRKSHV